MKLFKISIIISILISISCTAYEDILKDNGDTKIEKVFYNFKKSDGGMSHANIFITLEGKTDFCIKYHRLESGKTAEVREFMPKADSGTTEHTPIDGLTLKMADEKFKSMAGAYMAPMKSKTRPTITIRNCYSFTDLLAKELTGQDFDYTKEYLEKNDYTTEGTTIKKSKLRRSKHS